MKLNPYDHLKSIANKAMDFICKTSSGVTKAFNILLQPLFSQLILWMETFDKKL